MSELTIIELPALSTKGAEIVSNDLKSRKKNFAIELYLFKEMRGHVAIGWNSFDDYCKCILETPASTCWEWCKQVEVSLAVYGKTKQDLYNIAFPKQVDKQVDGNYDNHSRDSSADMKLITAKTAHELGKLSAHPEDIKQVYDELETMRTYAARTETQYHTELQRRVRAMLEMRKTLTIAPPEPTPPQETIEDHGRPDDEEKVKELEFEATESDREEEIEPTQQKIRTDHLPAAYAALNAPDACESAYHADYSAEPPKADKPATRLLLEMDSIGVSGEHEDYTFLVRAFAPDGQPVTVVLNMDCLPGELMETIHRKWERLRKSLGTDEARAKTYVLRGGEAE